MKLFGFIAVILTFLASCGSQPTKESSNSLREVLIEEAYSDGVIDEHTCRRVQSYSEGKVSEEECKSRLPSVNEHCKNVVRENIPENPEDIESARNVARILMTCPMATILDYPYYVIDGMPRIDFQN